MSDLESQLKSFRPKITNSSIRVYLGYIKAVYKLADTKKDITDLSWIESEYKDLIKKINNLKKNNKDVSKATKKNYFNSMIIFSNKEKGNPMYDELTKQRDNLNKELEEKVDEHKLSDKQCKSWLTKDQLEAVQNDLKEKSDVIFKKKTLTEKDIQQLQEHLLFTLIVNFSGRNSFSTLKRTTPTKFKRMTESAKSKNNWLILGKKDLRIRLYNFKVNIKDKFYEIEGMSDDIKNLIREFVKKVPDRTFIFHDLKGEPMTNLKLTSYLNRIFKRYYPTKKISTTMLRHIVLTHKHGESFKERCKDSNNFNHDLKMQDNYILLNE